MWSSACRRSPGRSAHWFLSERDLSGEATLYPRHDGAAEQAARLHAQHGDDDAERDREFHLASNHRNVGTGKVLDNADGEAADHGAARAGQSADDRAGKAVK